MELEQGLQALKDNGLELVTTTHYSIRPINVSDLYTDFFDEKITINDLTNEKSLETKISRVINRMQILLDEEEYNKRNESTEI